MAFIIVADSRSHEIDRRELTGPLVIGRSPECDLPVRDIMLSRRHCLIERIGEAWVVADLDSKNGTRVNGDPITRHVLHDLDLVRIGRTRIAFRDAPFTPAPRDITRSRERPASPLDAVSGTLSGFQFSEAEEQAVDQRVLDTFPRPQPKPIEPASYQAEQVQSMLTSLASSGWDAVLVAEPKVQTTTLPRPMIAPISRPKTARRTNTFSRPALPTRRPKTFNPQSAIALLFIGFGMIVTSLSVWVLSWSW